MNTFEWCSRAYQRGWTTVEKLKVWVAAGKLTPEEYSQITGIEYAP